MMLVAARPSVRVLWVTGTYFPELGGVSVHVERATRALCALCEVGLVTEPRHRGPDNGDISHFAVANLSRPSSLLQWNRAVADVRDVIAAFDPDVVHFGNACAAVFRSVVPAG